MTSWPVVLLPATFTAMVIRLDAKFVGPYFALSSLISATEGPDARDFYTDPARRRALIRRFLYPVILGFILGWFVTSSVDIAAAGAVTAGLLIWPVLFHGLPLGVSRRDWEIPVLYLSFSVSFALLAIGGSRLKVLLVAFSNGDVAGWLARQALSATLFWVLAIMGAGVFRLMFNRIETKTVRRGEIAYENERKRGSESLDSEPEEN